MDKSAIEKCRMEIESMLLRELGEDEDTTVTRNPDGGFIVFPIIPPRRRTCRVTIDATGEGRRRASAIVCEEGDPTVKPIEDALLRHFEGWRFKLGRFARKDGFIIMYYDRDMDAEETCLQMAARIGFSIPGVKKAIERGYAGVPLAEALNNGGSDVSHAELLETLRALREAQ